MKNYEKLNVALNLLAIVTFVIMVVNFLFGLPVLFKAAAACLSILVAVGNAYSRRSAWIILMWTGIAFLNVLNGMGLSFPMMMEMFR